jgi:tRNA-dihydrouridine synthase
MSNFWKDLPEAFSVLAPMEDVTDTVFRQVIIATGRPDVFFTEFTNCDGMCSIGQAKLIHRLKFSKVERPIVAQIWGASPKNYYETAKLCVELGFDGIDINMGCPERSVVKQGACSALINNEPLAKEILDAVISAVDGRIPVSVKTRIGLSTIVTKRWISFLLNQNIQALTVHGRTAKEMSEVPNHFDEIAIACKLRDQINPSCVMIANGDILDREHGIQVCKDIKTEGYMIGRGVFANPWCFNTDIKIEDVTKNMRFEILKLHLDLWYSTWDTSKAYPKLKKYFKIYCQSFPLASEIRIQLMNTNTVQEALKIVIDNID